MPDPLALIDQATVALAADGDGLAVTAIVRALERPIYAVAHRMLLDRGDAEDATQEALIRIVTRLAQFRGESSFKTWAYRIAVRRVLDFREQRAAAARVADAAFAADLADGLDAAAPERPEDAVLHHELKLSCSRAMLHCLDGDHRIAFVLGAIVGFDSLEAAEILELPPATFRKRLSRARERLGEFLGAHCGIFDPANPCRCHRRLERALALGRISLSATVPPGELPALRAHLITVSELMRVAAFYRAEPEPAARRDFVARVRDLISTKDLDS